MWEQVKTFKIMSIKHAQHSWVLNKSGTPANRLQHEKQPLALPKLCNKNTTVQKRDTHKLSIFQTSYLRRILHIFWPKTISNKVFPGSKWGRGGHRSKKMSWGDPSNRGPPPGKKFRISCILVNVYAPVNGGNNFIHQEKEISGST